MNNAETFDGHYGGTPQERTPGGVLAVLLVVFQLSLGACTQAPEYLSRGKQLLADGKFQEADVQFRNALKKDPGLAEAYLELGGVSLKLGNKTDAEKFYSQAIERDGKGLRAYLELSKHYLDAGNLEAAERVSKQGRDQLPTNTEMLELRKTVLGRRIQANPRDADALLEQGQMAENAGSLSDAMASYKNAEAIAANNPKVSEAVKRVESAAMAELARIKAQEALSAKICALPFDTYKLGKKVQADDTENDQWYNHSSDDKRYTNIFFSAINSRVEWIGALFSEVGATGINGRAKEGALPFEDIQKAYETRLGPSSPSTNTQLCLKVSRMENQSMLQGLAMMGGQGSFECHHMVEWENDAVLMMLWDASFTISGGRVGGTVDYRNTGLFLLDKQLQTVRNSAGQSLTEKREKKEAEERQKEKERKLRQLLGQ